MKDNNGETSHPRPMDASAGAWVSRRYIPKRVGRYDIKGVVGQGGMGIVLSAVQESTAQVVAVKLMANFDAGPREVGRFEEEGRLLAKLSHPAIARVLDAGSFRDDPDARAIPYLVMELVPGAKGLTVFFAQRQVPVMARLSMFVEICDAVVHLHQQGIIHRDLKPSNILVGTDGQPKIIDFGVARLANATQGHTLSGEVVGTLQYMSPEQLAGENLADMRSDVYSLGVILYEIIVGKLPYQVGSMNTAQALHKIQAVKPQRLRGIPAPRLSDLDAIVQKALKKEPADRYQMVADLQRDIARYLNDQPVMVRRYSMVNAAASWIRRTLAKQRAVAAALILAVGYVASHAAYKWVLSTPEGSDLQYRWTEVVAARGPARLPDMSDVRLIGMDATGKVEQSRLLEVDGVTDADPRSFRRNIASVVDLVSACGARVIVLDFTFVGESDHDSLLREAMASAVSRGCAIVFGEASSRPTAGEMTSRAFLGIPGVYRGQPLRMGPVSERMDQSSRVSEVVLAIKTPAGPVRPHMSLLGSLLLRQSAWTDYPPMFTIGLEPGNIVVGMARPLEEGRDVLDAEIEQMTTVPYHLSYPLGESYPEFGLKFGDQISSIVMAGHRWEEFREVVCDLEGFLAWSPREQSEFVAGKLVVVGDAGSQSRDVAPDGHGGVVPGCSVILQAAAELMEQPLPLVKALRRWADSPWHLAGCAAAWLSATLFASGRLMLAGVVATFVACAAAASSWVLWSRYGHIADPIPVVTGFLLTGFLARAERFFTVERR